MVLVGSTAGVGRTINVQPGESLNGVTDGSYTTQSDGEAVLFIDKGTGEWVAQVVGAPTSIASTLNQVTYPATDIVGVSGSTFITNSTNPAVGQTAINGGVYYDDGNYRYIRVDIVTDDDDRVEMSLGPNLMPAGGTIVQAHASGQPNGISGTYVAVSAQPGGSSFYFNRVDSVSADIDFSIWLKVHNPNVAGTTVLAGMLPIEDNEVVIFSEQLGLTGAQTLSLDGGLTWDTVKLEYASVRFEWQMDVTAVGIVEGTIEVPSDRIIQNARVRPEYGGAYYNLVYGATTGSDLVIPADFATINNYGLRVIGVKAQKTVINTVDTPVNDQSTSGYMDIGNMRMQWGSITGLSTPLGLSLHAVAFPAAFASNPTITGIVKVGNNLATGHETIQDYWAQDSSVSTTGFSIIARDTDGSVGVRFDWQAIGPKP